MTAGAIRFANYSLAYDNGMNTVGNLTGVAELDGSSVAYQYDPLYRLAAETRTGANPDSHAYGYDLAGNRTSVDGIAYSFDSANKHVPLSGINYDADGNILNVGALNFTWDSLNQLSSSHPNGANWTWQFDYDALGRMVYRHGVEVPSTVLVYDGDLLLGEVDAASGFVNAVYTWGANGLVSERLPQAGNWSLWYHFGPQGDVGIHPLGAIPTKVILTTPPRGGGKFRCRPTSPLALRLTSLPGGGSCPESCSPQDQCDTMA